MSFVIFVIVNNLFVSIFMVDFFENGILNEQMAENLTRGKIPILVMPQILDWQFSRHRTKNNKSLIFRSRFEKNPKIAKPSNLQSTGNLFVYNVYFY
jgi:hypothetical protein